MLMKNIQAVLQSQDFFQKGLQIEFCINQLASCDRQKPPRIVNYDSSTHEWWEIVAESRPAELLLNSSWLKLIKSPREVTHLMKHASGHGALFPREIWTHLVNNWSCIQNFLNIARLIENFYSRLLTRGEKWRWFQVLTIQVIFNIAANHFFWISKFDWIVL